MSWQPVELPDTDMFREQLEEFWLACRGRAQVEVGAVEAVRPLGVVRAAIESSTGGPHQSRRPGQPC